MDKARVIIVCIVAFLMFSALTLLYCLVPRGEEALPAAKTGVAVQFKTTQARQGRKSLPQSAKQTKKRKKKKKKTFSKPFAYTFSCDSKQDNERMMQKTKTEGSLIDAY